jgi:alpha-D-xyloside xylohydrolase
MRPLLYDFPKDESVYAISDQYMFGPDLMVAPIVEQGAQSRCVYLPKGATWKDAVSGTVYEGGEIIEYDAPISIIPVFLRDRAYIPVYKG